MITVTVSAKKELKKMLQANTNDPEVSLRLIAKPGGQLSFALGKEAEGDQVVEHSGIKVLLIGLELAPILDGMTLDVKDTPEGQKFSIS